MEERTSSSCGRTKSVEPRQQASRDKFGIIVPVARENDFNVPAEGLKKVRAAEFSFEMILLPIPGVAVDQNAEPEALIAFAINGHVTAKVGLTDISLHGVAAFDKGCDDLFAEYITGS